MANLEKPRCDGCIHYTPICGFDGECHEKGLPLLYAKADGFCPKHQDWDDYVDSVKSKEQAKEFEQNFRKAL